MTKNKKPRKRKNKVIELLGERVRCIDCEIRKRCKRRRVNQYAQKPCEDFECDLAKEAAANAAESFL